MPHHSVSVLDGNRFVVSDRHGDIRSDSRLPPHGFFADDTRFVSHWCLTVQGQPTDILSNVHVDYFVGQFFLVAPSPGFHSAPPLSIMRERLVGDVWLEQLLVVNHLDQRVDIAVDVEVDTDFADLFEVKDGRVRQRHIVAHTHERELLLRYRNGRVLRETRIAVSEPATIERDALRLRLALAPREEHAVSLTITPYGEQPDRRFSTRRSFGSFDQLRAERRAELAAWVADAPMLKTEGDTLRHTYERSLADLASLRFCPHIAAGAGDVPAAGLPWFMTLFGRDSLICSYQALPFHPDLAQTTLRTLAARQGTVVDAFRDEEPGKILHEMRFGELTATGELPHSPYYGSADATPLFVILLDAYEHWTGDRDLALGLQSAARAALDWIDRYGDLDGDGYVEYQTRNPVNGLANQCWKDSWNSILFADGGIADGPIATCEIQGYVYDAKRRAARLAREIWGDHALADRLLEQAAALRHRFLEDFWIPERAYFALALDGDKRQVDSLTSNIGHLLWSAIVDDDRANAIAAHLMSDALYSGWGVRTMAEGQGGYNPVEYHNGTVWPHDNSIIAAGLRRYGYHAEAARIADSLVRAAAFFGHRLPEVFAGFPAQMTHVPVGYPTASSPQAWAAGTPLLLLRTVLGLSPAGDELRCDPQLPATFGSVTLRGVPGRWGRADVSIDSVVDSMQEQDGRRQGAHQTRGSRLPGRADGLSA
jgi:glycogen debranching enzyme